MNPATWQVQASVVGSKKRMDQTRLSLSILQVHLTDHCNKMCTHCYQVGSEISRPELTSDQLFSLCRSYQHVCLSRGWKGQVVFTGGEPFLRKDFMYLLEGMQRFPNLRFAILTNGTFIDEAVAFKLETLRPAFVQISLDGGPETHDCLRGRGDFARCIEVLSILNRANVRTVVSFTAHRTNFRDFPIVAAYARKSGTRYLWADRLVQMGRGSQLETLSPEEAQLFFDLMYQEQSKHEDTLTTTVLMRRSLQFLCSDEFPYHCTAGKSLLAVLPNGLVYPCRRLPIPIGNILTTPLTELFDKGKSVCSAPSACEPCKHFLSCKGGARCITYAVSGNLAEADPGCWIYRQIKAAQ